MRVVLCLLAVVLQAHGFHRSKLRGGSGVLAPPPGRGRVTVKPDTSEAFKNLYKQSQPLLVQKESGWDLKKAKSTPVDSKGKPTTPGLSVAALNAASSGGTTGDKAKKAMEAAQPAIEKAIKTDYNSMDHTKADSLSVDAVKKIPDKPLATAWAKALAPKSDSGGTGAQKQKIPIKSSAKPPTQTKAKATVKVTALVEAGAHVKWDYAECGSLDVIETHSKIFHMSKLAFAAYAIGQKDATAPTVGKSITSGAYEAKVTHVELNEAHHVDSLGKYHGPYFISTVERQKTIVVSFRGSVSKPDWWSDFERAGGMSQVVWQGQTFHIHQGFDTLVRKLGYNAQVSALLAKNKGWSVVCTGHSLGGALAQLACWDLARTHGVKAYAYTYGSPRVGGAVWRADFMMRVEHYRVMNRNDAVPQVPNWGNWNPLAPRKYYHADAYAVRLVNDADGVPDAADAKKKATYHCIVDKGVGRANVYHHQVGGPDGYAKSLERFHNPGTIV